MSITLGEFLEVLSTGELSDIYIGQEGVGITDQGALTKLVGFTNSALTQLYTRFVHKRSYVNIELDEDIQEYWLDPAYAVSDETVGNDNARFRKLFFPRKFKNSAIILRVSWKVFRGPSLSGPQRSVANQIVV